MRRSASKKLAGLPKSGDSLADWFFVQFVRLLRKDTVRIARKKRLVNPDDPRRQVIRGLMDPDIHPSGDWVQILINPAKNTHRCRDEEVETLIHELSHALMPQANERAVLRMESVLSRSFTVQQRRYLKSFLPRHQIKRYPRLFLTKNIA